jgi:hypothetical protein
VGRCDGNDCSDVAEGMAEKCGQLRAVLGQPREEIIG